jgi:uncharacterized membrane protein
MKIWKFKKVIRRPVPLQRYPYRLLSRAFKNQKIMNGQFKSSKSAGFGTVLILVSAVIVILFICLPIISEKPIDQISLISGIIFTILVIGFFVWIWTTTFYAIDKKSLKSSVLHQVLMATLQSQITIYHFYPVFKKKCRITGMLNLLYHNKFKN